MSNHPNGNSPTSVVIEEADKMEMYEELKLDDEQRIRAFTLNQKRDRRLWLSFRGIGPHPVTMKRQRLARVPASLWFMALDPEQWTEMVRRLAYPDEYAIEENEYHPNLHYGSTLESTAWKITQRFLRRWLATRGYVQIWFVDPGTLIDGAHPYLSASSDGLVFAVHRDGHLYVATVEMKCPGPQKPEVYPETPDKHQTQFQAAANLLAIPDIWFVVYTPRRTVFRRYARQHDHHRRHILPRLHHFFWNLYLPRAILRERSLNNHECIAIPPQVSCSLTPTPSFV